MIQFSPAAPCTCRTPPPHASGLGWNAYNGDNRQILASYIEPESVHAIITDPPYGSGANSMTARARSTNKKYRTTGAAPLPDFNGDSLLPEAWQYLMESVCRQLYRVAAPGADLLMFCDWRSLPQLLRIVGAAGFNVRGVPVWDKGRGSRPQKNGFRSQSELILWASKPGKIDRPEPVYLDGVIPCTTLTQGKQHVAQKPLPLMAELLKLAPAGGLVLDPFQGSGTTGVAALQAGHRYLGIESTKEYHAVAVKRLQEAER